MQIPLNHKFAAIFLSRCGGPIPDSLSLGKIQIGRSLRVEWEDWAEWLGSIVLNELKDDGLLFYATGPSANPEVLDHENEALRRRVNLVLSGLLILGVPRFMRGIVLVGARTEERLAIRQYTAITDIRETFGQERFGVDVAVMRRALYIGDRLQEIQTAVGRRWGRLGRAVSALLKANKEENERGERFHQLVRSIEGLIRPRIMRTAQDFAHRGQTFALAKAGTPALLRQIFDLRSQIEHLHLATEILTGSHQERIDIVSWRTRQVDALARFALCRVLETPDLFENVFDSDDHIEAFWRLHDGDRVRRWGARLDVSLIE